MFAPNRFLTTKEQWLLVGVIVAVITGCATLFLHETVSVSRHEEPVNSPVGIIRTQQRATPSVAAPVSSTPLPTAQTKHQDEATPPDSEPVPSEEPEAETPETIGVAVMGAVHRPDLYWLDADARVADLIALAGGTTEHADLSDIIVTAPLVDETTLTIPELPEVRRNGTKISVRRRTTAVINPPWYRRTPLPTPAQHDAVPQAEQITTPQITHTPSATSHASPPISGIININQASQAQLEELPGIGPVLATRIIAERERQPFMTVEELTRVPGIAEKRLKAILPQIVAP